MGAIFASQKEHNQVQIKIKDALALIPEYSSKSVIEYVYFREGCLEALDLLGPKHERSLLKFIKLKLKGMAYSQYALRVSKFDNLPDFLEYVQKRDFKELYDMRNWEEKIKKVQQESEESIRDYGARMESALQCALITLKLLETKSESHQQIKLLATQCFKDNMIKKEKVHSNNVLNKREHIIDDVLLTERWLENKWQGKKCKICYSIYHSVDECYYAKHNVIENASKGDCKIRTNSPNNLSERHELKSSSANADHQALQGKQSSKDDKYSELQKQECNRILHPSIDIYLNRDEQKRLEMRHREEKNKLLQIFEESLKTWEEKRAVTARLVNKESEEMLELIYYAREIFAKDESLRELLNSYPAISPPPLPPTLQKTDLYVDPRKFADVDTIAIDVAQENQESVTDLVRQLLSKFDTDVEKVRAIFRWVLVKDRSTMQFGGTIRDTETNVVLFQRLCSYAGLHCKVIDGYSKDDRLEEEDRKYNLNTRNWNAVFVANSWRFVNCEPANVAYWKRDDEHYFMTDPQEFIYHFFPLQKEWQLLEQPISFKDFEKLPNVSPEFFKWGLRFQNTNAVMHTDASGKTTVTIEMSADVQLTPILSCDLKFYNYNDITLTRFVMQTVVDNEVIIRVHAPCPNSFRLTVYAEKDLWDETTRSKICEFKIVCKELQMVPVPLPECKSHEWGPNKATRLYGLVPISHHDADVRTDSELLNIKFRMTRPLDGFKATLCTNDVEEDQLNKYVSHVVTGDVITFSISFPTKGQYGLDIYVRELSKSYLLEHCCQYLINYNSK